MVHFRANEKIRQENYFFSFENSVFDARKEKSVQFVVESNCLVTKDLFNVFVK